MVHPHEYRTGILTSQLGSKDGTWPVYRVMMDAAAAADDDDDDDVDFSDENPIRKNNGKENPELLLKMHQIMTRLRVMDEILELAQRQGRLSFYMQSRGEEAIHIGSGSALSLSDAVFGQYREQGVLLWRGFTLEQVTDQCFSNERDLGRGRQMPIHYGSKALNFHTISSPLATQLPHAVGAAYFMYMKHSRGGESKGCSICYFGEGAASEGDFHAAMNFAATLVGRCPMIFFCRNNGYAISTPVTDQYSSHSDGIVGRAPGYGMPAIRVDGNDVLAVHRATLAARELALEKNTPVFIEAMTYRVAHHSTSDDSTQYRSKMELEDWSQPKFDPLSRFEEYLVRNEEIIESGISLDFEQVRSQERKSVLDAMAKSEKKKPPSIDTMFTDVYAEKPPHLIEQEESLHRHLASLDK